MTNIAAMAKVGSVDLNMRMAILDAMEKAEIDHSYTCFQGNGPHLSIEQFHEVMSWIDELAEATPW